MIVALIAGALLVGGTAGAVGGYAAGRHGRQPELGEDIGLDAVRYAPQGPLTEPLDIPNPRTTPMHVVRPR